jgi:hypothetical protein
MWIPASQSTTCWTCSLTRGALQAGARWKRGGWDWQQQQQWHWWQQQCCRPRVSAFEAAVLQRIGMLSLT